MTARCEITGLVLAECAGTCCRPDLKQFQPVPEVWMRATVPADRPLIPAPADVRGGNVHALFQVVSGRSGRPEAVDMVRELCEPYSHLVRYELDQVEEQPTSMRGKRKGKARRQKAGRKSQPRYHRTARPALLDQLYGSVTPSGSAEAGTSRPASSRPAARLDAIDAANRIDTQVDVWLNRLGIAPASVVGVRKAGAPLTESELKLQDSIRSLRHLASHGPSLEFCGRPTAKRDPETKRVTCCPCHELEADIARWWTWARVVTGWDTAAWQPANTCPLCGTRGTLRVRLDEQRGTCVNDACRETWDHTNIGLLAEHIRAENNDTEEAS